MTFIENHDAFDLKQLYRQTALRKIRRRGGGNYADVAWLLLSSFRGFP